MSNNIYDILKKFNSLDSVKNMLSEGKKVCKDCGKAKCECVNESKGSKPDFLDMDKDGDTNEPMKKAAKDKSKGAIAEAVARVEQNLAEKYQGFKKSVAEGVKPKGTISPTDSGEEYTAAPGYRVKAEFEPGSTGKPKMGFVKSDPEQKGQGAKPAQTSPGIAPSAKEVNEASTVDFEKVLNAIAALYGDDIWDNDAMQDLADDLEQAGPTDKELDFIIAKGKLPRRLAGIQFSAGDNVQFGEGEYNEDLFGTEASRKFAICTPDGEILKELENVTVQQAMEVARKMSAKYSDDYDELLLIRSDLNGEYDDSQEIPFSKEVNEGEYNEDMLSPGQKKIARMSPPPNKIDANDLAALRAGKKKKAEGNAFSGAVAKAKATGQDKFNVGGNEYEVQEGIEDTLQNILPKSMQPFNTETAAKNAAAARASKAQAPVKEGFPTVDDAKKRMDAKAGKTAHGTKTVTKTGVKHERNYDADEPTGERGRPKKDKFAK